MLLIWTSKPNGCNPSAAAQHWPDNFTHHPLEIS
jgi:hypothetical protein